MNSENNLEHLIKEEKTLTFKTFTNQDAYQIASLIIEEAKALNASIVVHIVVNGRVIFHYAFDGTTSDNDRWIERKANIVVLYQHSSYYMGLLVEKTGSDFTKALSLPEDKYSPSGGCYPLRLRDGIVFGHISVSGYTPEEDHNAIVRALKKHISC